MKIYFARHGETDWNAAGKIQGTTDTQLNARGLEQAKLLADDLAGKGADLFKVYSSRQTRAYTTAKTVAERFGVSVARVDGLEEMSLGVWEGQSWPDIQAAYPREVELWRSDKMHNRAPGGECYRDVLERLFRALDEIMAENRRENPAGQDILIVSHGAVLFVLFALKNDASFDLASSGIRIKNAAALEMDASEIEALKNKFYDRERIAN